MREIFMDDKEGFSYSPPPEETHGVANPAPESLFSHKRHVLTPHFEVMPAAAVPATETIYAETEMGTRPIEVPIDPEDKIKLITDVLDRLEKTREPDGGPSIRRDVVRVDMIINALQNPNYLIRQPAEVRRIISDLYQEYTARLYFHQAYVAYDGANSIEDVQKAANSIRAEHLNTLFSNEDFIYFLNEYEQNGEEFTKSNAPSLRRSMLEKASRESGKTIEELEAARNRAERFWQFSGRRATQDVTVSEGDYLTTGTYKFDDDLVGGNFQMRRLLRWKDWAKTQVKSFGFKLQIIDGVELQQGDFFSEMMAKIKDAFPGAIYSANVKDTVVKEGSREVVKTKTVDKLNFLGVNWFSGDNKFDFRVFGDNPMSFWAFSKLAQPEAARKALTDGADSLIRNPLPEALWKLKDTFNYQAFGSRGTKETLLIRVIKFLEKDNKNEMKRPNYKFEQRDKVVFDAVQQNYITKDELPIVEEKALGPLRNFRRAGYLFNLLEFLLGVFEGIRDQLLKGR